MTVQLQKADVIFYKPQGIIGKIIAKLSKSNYSHVVIYVGEGKVVESNRFVNTRKTDVEYSKDIHSVYRLAELDKDEKEVIIDTALSLVGKKYDYIQIIGLFFRIVFGWKSDSFNQANKFICSEIIDKSFFSADIPRSNNKNRNDLTPQELLYAYDMYKVY